MKYNFNSIILDNQTYLFHLFDNNHIKHTDFERYVQTREGVWRGDYPALVHLSEIHGIDVTPYLYTMDRVTNNERESFTKFFIIYLQKTNMIDLEVDGSKNALDLASISLDHLVAFIVTMQYFFL
jgi:hypothetical protein